MSRKEEEPKKIEVPQEEASYVTKIEVPQEEASYVTKSDFREFMESIGAQLKAVVSSVKKQEKSIEANSERFHSGYPIEMDEIGRPGPIEKVSEKDFIKAAEMEAFMNQKLLIQVSKSTNKEDLDTIVPNVNGVNQPIIRGVDVWVKRKFVEALARCTHTRYEQRVPDVAKPDRFVMDRNTSLKDPFIVKKDPHKFGIQWLDAILREEM